MGRIFQILKLEVVAFNVFVAPILNRLNTNGSNIIIVSEIRRIVG